MRAILLVVLSFTFFVLGFFNPSLILLDAPFGLGYFFANLVGLWDPSPYWVKEHRAIALFCFLGCPLSVSALFSYITLKVAFKLWRRKSWGNRSSAVAFVIMLLALVLAVRVEPGAIPISFHVYSAFNY